ncbi:hypothetical protein AB0C11_33520 [Streptomyces sp. NPDC039016]|uniref:hypothetical protein n=1 Tax=Streptomyces sp. NPDC039016 TaxID=3154330 RepID=UPI00340D562E
MAKGKGWFTVQTAKNAGDRTNNDRGKKARQEELGARHTRQTHVCQNSCDDDCPLGKRK